MFQTLCAIFKHGKRSELLSLVDIVFVDIFLNENDVPGVHRVLRAKLTQRVGLALLPPRAARWRYQQKIARLLASAPAAAGQATPVTAEPPTVEDDNGDPPQQLEAIMEQLFGALQHRDTVARYCAAKGIARVCNRLSEQVAQEIIERCAGRLRLVTL